MPRRKRASKKSAGRPASLGSGRTNADKRSQFAMIVGMIVILLILLAAFGLSFYYRLAPRKCYMVGNIKLERREASGVYSYNGEIKGGSGETAYKSTYKLEYLPQHQRWELTITDYAGGSAAGAPRKFISETLSANEKTPPFSRYAPKQGTDTSTIAGAIGYGYPVLC